MPVLSVIRLIIVIIPIMLRLDSDYVNPLWTVYTYACFLTRCPQGYVVCPSEQRFLLLFTFLKRNMDKKVMVFLSSCNSVKFHAEILNYIDIPVMDIYVSWRERVKTVTGARG